MKLFNILLFIIVFLLVFSQCNTDGYQNIDFDIVKEFDHYSDEKPNNIKYLSCNNNYIKSNRNNLYDLNNKFQSKKLDFFYNAPLCEEKYNTSKNNLNWQFKEIIQGQDNTDLYLQEKILKSKSLIDPMILNPSPNESIKILYDNGQNYQLFNKLYKTRLDISGYEEDDKDYIMGHGWHAI